MKNLQLNSQPKLSELNGNEYIGLLFDCSISKGLCECTFKKLRELPVVDRINAWQSYSGLKRNMIIQEHQLCIKKEVVSQARNIHKLFNGILDTDFKTNF